MLLWTEVFSCAATWSLVFVGLLPVTTSVGCSSTSTDARTDAQSVLHHSALKSDIQLKLPTTFGCAEPGFDVMYCRFLSRDCCFHSVRAKLVNVYQQLCI